MRIPVIFAYSALKPMVKTLDTPVYDVTDEFFVFDSLMSVNQDNFSQFVHYCPEQNVHQIIHDATVDQYQRIIWLFCDEDLPF